MKQPIFNHKLTIMVIMLLMFIMVGNLFSDNLTNSVEELLITYKEQSLFIYFFVCFLQPIVLPLPEPVTIMFGSTLFGPLAGAIIGFLGTILGIVTMFLLSRYANEKLVKHMVDEKKIEKFNQYIQKNETIILLGLFILPILPDEVICIGAGLTKVNGYKFVIIAFVAKLITACTLAYGVGIFN